MATGIADDVCSVPAATTLLLLSGPNLYTLSCSATARIHVKTRQMMPCSIRTSVHTSAAHRSGQERRAAPLHHLIRPATESHPDASA